MDSLRFTLVQSHLVWEDKSANLKNFEEKINGIQEPTNIVVLPEMFSTGFSMQPEKLAEPMDGDTVNWMKEIASKKNIILTGSLIIKEDDQYYNRMLWVLPNGQVGQYNKRHCFSLAGEDQHYTHGEKRAIANVGGWRINLQICYDLRFPVWARQQLQQDDEGVYPEYDVLLYVANWPSSRAHAWKTLLNARAIENQSYVIGVNRVGADGNGTAHGGDSLVIDPLGETMYHASSDESVQTVVLEKTKLDQIRERFPFWSDADAFFISE
ncbi:MAG: amidohydrolase [Bacteroidota bacterium]